jgi:hypothetical protein
VVQEELLLVETPMTLLLQMVKQHWQIQHLLQLPQVLQFVILVEVEEEPHYLELVLPISMEVLVEVDYSLVAVAEVQQIT